MARRAIAAGARTLAAAVQPPAAPSGVILTVVARGAQFGLKLDWTPAAELAGTVGYERAVRYYSDSGLTTPVSDWITLGTTPGAEAATDESGPYTRPAADQWVRGRIRAVNTDSGLSDPVYSGTAPKVDAGVGAEPPAAPTGTTITVLDRGVQFAIRLNWTAAADVGGTVSYERAVRYFADAGLSTPTTDWITLGTTYGASTLTDESGPYSRAANDRWIKGRVRSLNADGSASAWVESAGAKVDSVVTQITAFTAAVTDYGKEGGTDRPKIAITVSVTQHPAGADYFSVWVYEGAVAPSDRSLYEHAADQPIAVSGTSSVPVWRFHNAAATLHILVTTSSYAHYSLPTSGSPYQSVSIPALTPVAQPTGFNVTVQPGDSSGIATGRYVYAFAPPPDLNFWTANIYRRWCTAPGVPAPGATWLPVESSSVPRAQPDWWLLPNNPEYWEFKIQSVTKGGLENTTSPPTVNVTVPTAATAPDVASVYQIAYASGVTVNANNGTRQFITLSGPCHFYAPANAANRTLRLTILQDGTGGRVPTFDASWGLPDGFAVAPDPYTYTAFDLWFNAAGRAFHASSPITRMP